METPEKTKSQYEQMQQLNKADLAGIKCRKVADKKNRIGFIRLLAALGVLDVKL